MSPIRAMVVCAAVGAVTAGMNCRTGICPEETPIYDPLTGECVADDADTSDDGDGGVIIVGGPTAPPGPGTGGLPTEPETDTSMGENSDPEAINLLIYA